MARKRETLASLLNARRELERFQNEANTALGTALGEIDDVIAEIECVSDDEMWEPETGGEG